LVHPLAPVDVVQRSVNGDGAILGGPRGRVVSAEVLDNIVLDERVGGPPIDGKIAVTVGAVCS
jgi:hypothetical protein